MTPRLRPADEAPRRASLRECFEHTDLEWRLAQIPDSAACRGTFLNMLDDRAGEFGPATQRAYRDFFQLYSFSAFKFYPVKDYLTRMVTLAQIQFGGPDIYRGIFEIQAAAFPAWQRTLVGKAMFAVLGTDFDDLIKRIEKTQSSGAVVNYGYFRLERDRPDHYNARFMDYVYIEHAMAGALEGVARVCGVEIDLAVTMHDAFHGDIGITVMGQRQRRSA